MTPIPTPRIPWDAATCQSYPAGCLYVVATPIGNVADISVRALHVLSLVHAIACEDTRHTQGLLRIYGLEKPLLAVHEHNEAEMAELIVRRLQLGERIAYVSDAGTPGVSDPGARLVKACQHAGLRCIPLPGASSVTAALSVSGVTGSPLSSSFVFLGFLDTRTQSRERQIDALVDETRTIVLLEAPHRIEATLSTLSRLGPRKVTIAREISKQFEEIAILCASEAGAWLAAGTHRNKGEFVLVIHAPESVASSNASADMAAIPPSALRMLELLLQEVPLKLAVKLVTELCDQPRNLIYAKALEIKSSDG